ncbi:MAG: hypothetical protein H6Q02_1161 [Acidobacteria bacterium]|nr:hypothetical protein [Acidobacteriota bacterium]
MAVYHKCWQLPALAILVIGLLVQGRVWAQPEPAMAPGQVEGTGTHFEVTDSPYLNITVDSSEPIHLSLSSVPEVILMAIESTSGATSTQLTISGLAADTAYYVTTGRSLDEAELVTDATGTCSVAVDISQPLLLTIQPRPSTVYIDDSPTGRDCSRVGNWDFPTLTCTLNRNVYELIRLSGSGVTLDGGGFRIAVSNGTGIRISSASATLRGLRIEQVAYGVMAENSTVTTLDSTISGNKTARGILVFYSSAVNIGNKISNFAYGISHYRSSWCRNDRNTLIGNVIAIMDEYSYSVSTNNLIVSNGAHGFFVINSDGASPSIITNNTIAYNDIGVYVNSGTARVWNNIIAFNRGRGIYALGSGLGDYNDVYGNGTNYWNAVPGLHDISADPLFATTADPYYRLTELSPAIDSGSNAAPGLPATDFDGNPRIGGPFVDIGAFEFPRSNSPPVAEAGGPYVTSEGTPVTLDGSASTDPDGAIVSYEWDFDGDGLFDAFGPLVEFVAPDDASHLVRLRVTDDFGENGEEYTDVTVVNVYPVVQATGSGQAPPAVEWTGSGSFTDPGADQWTATLDYGDGTSPVGVVVDPSEPIALSHIFTRPGNFTVTLTVIDDDGGSGTAALVVEVINAPPVAEAGGPYPTVEGTAVWLHGSASTDPDGAIVSYEWDFGGDGTIDATGSTVEYPAPPDNGVFDVVLKVTDAFGETGVDDAQVIAENVPPVVEAGADAAHPEGGTYVGSGSLADVPSDTWTAAVNYGDGSGDQPLGLVGQTFALTHAYADNGSYTVTVTVTDDDGGIGTDTLTVSVTNVAPVVAGGPDGAILEGMVFGGAGSFSDPGADGWTATVDYGDGSTLQPLVLDADRTFALSHMYADNGVYLVTVTVVDDDGAVGGDTVTVTVGNVPPAVGPITAPLDPVAVSAAIDVSAAFGDAGVMDTHTALWDWGDGANSAGSVSEAAGSGTVAGTHTYAAAGVFVVSLTVFDDDGGVGHSFFEFVVVFDPDGGFVTGGGWIMSPQGAFIAEPALTGKANFGFVSKYVKGATTPSGQTEFQFKAAGLDFHSTSYEWLVVAGSKAQYKGIGTVNGQGEFKFLLTAVDADVNAADGLVMDRFRIKIWSESNGVETVIYDNGLGDTDYDDDPTVGTTEIGGGSIVIHKSK